jgi:hypothetical protein
MLETVCTSCEFGEHDRCQGGQAAPEGVLGGWRCRCEGECVDGRYVSPQFEATTQAIREGLRKVAEMSAPLADTSVPLTLLSRIKARR